MWACSIQSSGLSFLILGTVFVCGKQPGAGSKRAVISDGTSELHFPGYVPALQVNGYAIFSTVWWLFRYSCCIEDSYTGLAVWPCLISTRNTWNISERSHHSEGLFYRLDSGSTNSNFSAGFCSPSPPIRQLHGKGVACLNLEFSQYALFCSVSYWTAATTTKTWRSFSRL